MIYALWDTETDNLVDDYDDERAALAAVRDAIERHGSGIIRTLALTSEDSDGRVTTLAIGDALIQRATVHAASPFLISANQQR